MWLLFLALVYTRSGGLWALLCKQMCKQFYYANYFCWSNLLQSSSTSWQHLSSYASSDTAQEAKVHFPRCFCSGKGLGLQKESSEEVMARQRSHCQTHKRQSVIMRTRSGTGRSFICLALQIATAGRRKIRLLIYNRYVLQIRWKFCWIHLPLNIPVLIPEKIGMELEVSLSVYR